MHEIHLFEDSICISQAGFLIGSCVIMYFLFDLSCSYNNIHLDKQLPLLTMCYLLNHMHT